MKKRRMIAGLASCAMATTLVACSSGSSDKNNTLTVGVNQELNGVFSPAYYSSSYDNYAIDLVYEGLLGYNAENELVPELAQEMPEISEDGLTFTFKIREGAKFSDGTPVTSKDVKYSFTLLADPSYTGRFAINAENIVGYEEYNKGDATELTGIETPDDETVIIHAKEPRIDNLVTFGDSVRIMSAAQFDYKKGDTSEIESNTSDMLGSGPYKLNSYDKASGASFVRNENYEAKDGEYTVEKIIIKTTDVQTEVDELKSGNVDLLPQTIEQQKILTKYIENSSLKDYPYRVAAFLQMYMGLRIGEANALSIEDIDLDRKQIYVHKTVTLDRSGKPVIREHTKTEAGTRTLPIPDSILPYIKEQIEVAKTHKNHLLFVNERGGIVRESASNSQLKTRLINLGIYQKNMSTHTLRHTYATRYMEASIRAGIDKMAALTILSKLMGHSDIYVTIRTYITVFDEIKEQLTKEVSKYYDTLDFFEEKTTNYEEEQKIPKNNEKRRSNIIYFPGTKNGSNDWYER